MPINLYLDLRIGIKTIDSLQLLCKLSQSNSSAELRMFHYICLVATLCAGAILATAQISSYTQYPNDCQLYYTLDTLQCPRDYHWSQKLQKCADKRIAGCLPLAPNSDFLPTTGRPESEEHDLVQLCGTQIGPLIPYPGNCTLFIQCDYIPFVKTCPQFLYWNSKLQTCDKNCV